MALLRHHAHANAPYVGGGLERELSAIWAEVLGVAEPKAADDFFALGGTSLHAMQIVSHLSRALGVLMPPEALFQAPTLGQFAEAVAGADRAPQRRERGHRRQPPIPSKLQRNSWFACSLDPDSTPHVGDTLLLSGELNVEALEHALSEVVRRHEILRTVFPASGIVPSVLVLEPEPIRIPSIDLRGMEASRQRMELQRCINETRTEPFDFHIAPSLRVVLIRLRASSNVLVIVAHELVCDGQSSEILMYELAQWYNKSCGETPAVDVLEAPLQYFDIVRARHLDGDVRSTRRKGESADTPLTVAYPLESGGFPIQVDGSEGHEAMSLADSLTARLRVISAQESVTPFVLHLAAFSVLLYKCTREPDLMIMIHTAGRPSPDLEEVIGYFAMRRPVHVRLDSTHSFRQLLRQIAASVLEIATAADMTSEFETLEKKIEGVRGLTASPIVFRYFDRLHDRPLRFAGLRVERVFTAVERGHLIMRVSERRRQPSAVKLDSSEMGDQALRILLERYRQVLARVADDPDKSLREIELVSSVERQKMIGEWGGERDAHELRPVHRLIADRARRTPDAIAIWSERERLTYCELERRAGGVAEELRVRGVAPGELVGVAIAPSTAMVVAMLGAFKRGAICVPIDIDYDRSPTDDSVVLSALIVDGSPLAYSTKPRVTIDMTAAAKTLGADIDRDEELPESCEFDRPAFVLQTAGVTGSPRQVLLTHRTLAHVASRCQRIYALTESDRAFHLPGVGARSWALTPWRYLAIGATVISPMSAQRQNASQIAGWLTTCRATVAGLPAALASSVLAFGRASPSSLRAVFVHGRASIVPRAGAAVFREYTVAEAGGVAMSAREEEKVDVCVIGSGAGACARAYILDRDLNVVPPGEIGELYLGGAGLAESCLVSENAADDTFMPDPFTEAASARMVKTGDLARRRRDGKLEFVERIVDEVRFRGFRLNAKMRELEAALARNPTISAAATSWDEGRESLTAYVMLRPGSAPFHQDLDLWVRRTMTAWILPSRYVAVDRIPLRHDGVVDRHALAEMSRRTIEGGSERRGPLARRERELISIWKKVLKRRRIRANDNFFQIGGDLALACEMIARASGAGLPVAMDSLIAGPTIAELTMQWADHDSPQTELRRQ
jgi:non-ribosomal peptide synthetase component F/acyl carrier protein